MKKENKNTKKNEDIELNIKFNKQNLIKGVGIFLVVALVLSIAFVASKNMKGNSSAFEFTNITLDEYLEKMKGEEKSIIYVARPGCSWCQKETPIVKRVAGDNNLEIFYLNTDSFYDSETKTYTEEGKRFMESADEYKDGWGTPNTIIVQNGSIIDGVYGYVEANELKDLFIRNGFING
jgi:predicted bacteriocin transport accessory protein